MAQGRRDTEFSHTVEALFHTLLISLAAPSFLWYLGMRLASASTGIDQATALAQALQEAMDRCAWFTVGVMAPSASQAIARLRCLEGRRGWKPLTESPASEPAASDAQAGGVFLKGNQSTGLYAVRQEAGLGEGILITGHNSSDPAGEDTWGPLPLGFFA